MLSCLLLIFTNKLTVEKWVDPFLLYFQICLTKTEHKVVNPSKSKFYKRFVGNIINRRNKNQPDDLFQKLISNHANIKYMRMRQRQRFFLTQRLVIVMR